MKLHVTEKTDLLDFLVDKLHVSRTRVRKWIKYGSINVDGQIADRAEITVFPGQTVETSRPSPLAPFPVLYEDRYLIVGEKPAGLLSIATERETSETFYRRVNEYVRLRSHNKERIFIVHRLDREVSGITLFAKSEAIQASLQRGWDKTEKLYWALVEGRPPKKRGTIKTWLTENRIHKVHSTDETQHAKYAVTHYRTLKEYQHHTVLEIRLETGRKHQIRVHLSELGCPIVGDRKYGASANPFRRLALHAFSLSFTHPISGERIRLESKIPKVFSSSSVTS